MRETAYQKDGRSYDLPRCAWKGRHKRVGVRREQDPLSRTHCNREDLAGPRHRQSANGDSEVRKGGSGEDVQGEERPSGDRKKTSHVGKKYLSRGLRLRVVSLPRQMRGSLRWKRMRFTRNRLRRVCPLSAAADGKECLHSVGGAVTARAPEILARPCLGKKSGDWFVERGSRSLTSRGAVGHEAGPQVWHLRGDIGRERGTTLLLQRPLLTDRLGGRAVLWGKRRRPAAQCLRPAIRTDGSSSAGNRASVAKLRNVRLLTGPVAKTSPHERPPNAPAPRRHAESTHPCRSGEPEGGGPRTCSKAYGATLISCWSNPNLSGSTY